MRFLFIACMLLTGCATALERKYDQFYEQIQADHDKQRFPENETPISDRRRDPQYRADFDARVCKGLDKAQCSRQSDEAMYVQMRDKYYAADHPKVANVCSYDPVDCIGPVWERMVIKSHNEGIEWHRKQALSGLEAWRAGTQNNLDARQAEIFRQWLERDKGPKLETLPVNLKTDCTTQQVGHVTMTSCE